MASSLAEIDEQLSELGDVPKDVAAILARHGDDDLSLSHVDAVLAELEQGVQLASVASIGVTPDAPPAQPPAEVRSEEPVAAEPPADESVVGEPADESVVGEPPADESVVAEPPAAEPAAAAPPVSSSNHWDPDSALLDGPEWFRAAAEQSDDAKTGEVPIPADGVGDSGEVEAAKVDAAGAGAPRHPDDIPPRRPRGSRDTMVDSPGSGGADAGAVGAATPITGEFMVDDGALGAPATEDYLDDELDDILGGDEAGDDDVTMIASAAMLSNAAAPAPSDADADAEEFEDATGEDNDSFEMLIEDEEIELIDEDELEVLIDEDE